MIMKAEKARTIDLGRSGENLARTVTFDTAHWQKEYGIGTVQLIAQRHGDKDPYPVSITVSGSTVSWDITSADTAKEGRGMCELRYYVGEVLVKSETWATQTLRAMGDASENPPESQKGWVDQVLEAGTNAINAVTNPPKLSENNTWLVWDFDKGAYVDTGVSASGNGSGGSVDLKGYATEKWVQEGYQPKGNYLTEHQDISGKLDTNKLPEAVNNALAQAKESGAFDGKDGYTPVKGVDYFDGQPGYTPKKGVDYFDGEDGKDYVLTEADKTEIAEQAAGLVEVPEGSGGIAVTGAKVGQTVKIAEVDENGVPTAWEPMDVSYTKPEIDAIMGSYVTDIDNLVGGDV